MSRCEHCGVRLEATGCPNLTCSTEHTADSDEGLRAFLAHHRRRVRVVTPRRTNSGRA